MKKTRCLTALWIANILLLAHAAIPHHYHENTGVCFVLHCKDSKEPHRHEYSDFHTHQHEGNPHSEECYVDDVYTAANKKNAYCSHSNCDCGTAFYSLFSNNLSIKNFIDSKHSTFFKPYLLSDYTDYITQSLGLRAPPIL